MVEYRVVYIAKADGAEPAAVAGKLQRECNSSAMEGWRFTSAVPDAAAGTTSGLWLIFSSESASSEAVALAEELMAENQAS
jgi:hypothetical protein